MPEKSIFLTESKSNSGRNFLFHIYLFTNPNSNMVVKLSTFLLVCHVHLAHNIILESIYQKYLIKQGLQFRENIFLGNKPILSEYDFIIIGGGVGGSVMANRLSENPNWKILLLEGGEDENIYTNIPLLAHFNSLTHFNWKYKIEKNTNHSQCLAMYNDECPCPRGKGLGGSSILNYMIYTRGNKKDYEEYEAAGNKGWGYQDVLPYFLKSENNTSEFLDSNIHSHGGPLKVTNIPYPNLLTEKLIQASCELGYPNYDYTGNNPGTEGFSKLQATITKGQRCSANRAYLKSVKERTWKNLHISIFSHVTRILIDPNTKRAHGVEFSKNGVKRVVLAKKEVILSAGAIGSPQILLLSGVGPEEHLREYDINVVSNLRGVGQNMDDHHAFFGLTFVMNRTKTGSTIEKSVVTMDQFLKWLKLGRGPLSVPGGVTGIGYLNTKYNTDKSRPDTEYLFSIGSFNSDAGRILRKSMNIRKDVYDSIYGNINNRESWSLIPVVLKPKSKGSVTLKSKNPFKYPRISYDFFAYEEDINVMLEGIKNVIRISETDAFRSIGSQLHKTPIRDCAHFEFGCDDYWKCAMKYFTASFYHQCGTCKMGPQEDSMAVVNDQLQVYGVTSLRVVDSSIFPSVPSAHLYAPTVMVAEKAADMIKETWKNFEENDKHPNSGCYSHPGGNKYEYNKPNKLPCSGNNLQEINTTDYYKPTQLDNQKLNSTHSESTSESPLTTSSETTPEEYSPIVPEEPNIMPDFEISTTTTTEAPYQETSSSVSTPSIFNTGYNNNPSQGRPQTPPPVSSTYPPYAPSQQPNVYPTSFSNNIGSYSGTYKPSYQQFPQQYQFNKYPNQTSLHSHGHNAAYVPSDNYHIHTIYPGSSSANKHFPPQTYNPANAPYAPVQSNFQTFSNSPEPAVQPVFYQTHPVSGDPQPIQSNGYPVAQAAVRGQYPQKPRTSLVSNEILEPSDDIMFPNKHGKLPSQQLASSTVSYEHNEPNSSGLTSLSNIPYYNTHQQRQGDLIPNPFTWNQSMVPAAIFINPELLFQMQGRYFRKRAANRLNKRLARRRRKEEAKNSKKDI